MVFVGTKNTLRGVYLAPVVGFEPTTISLTGSRSTAELHRNTFILRYWNVGSKYDVTLLFG